MYDNRIHSVEHRIVSISQPWLRPIVRGKVKAPVEFGAKFDLSLDSEGYGRLEKISFEAYNESTCLIEAIERFKERTGYYPERVLADQIYRTRENRSYCKEHGIRLSGYNGTPVSQEELDCKTIIDRLHTDNPAWGARQMSSQLKMRGHKVGRRKARRYMTEMGIDPIYPKINLSKRM